MRIGLTGCCLVKHTKEHWPARVSNTYHVTYHSYILGQLVESEHSVDTPSPSFKWIERFHRACRERILAVAKIECRNSVACQQSNFKTKRQIIFGFLLYFKTWSCNWLKSATDETETKHMWIG